MNRAPPTSGYPAAARIRWRPSVCRVDESPVFGSLVRLQGTRPAVLSSKANFSAPRRQDINCHDGSSSLGQCPRAGGAPIPALVPVTKETLPKGIRDRDPTRGQIRVVSSQPWLVGRRAGQSTGARSPPRMRAAACVRPMQTPVRLYKL